MWSAARPSSLRSRRLSAPTRPRAPSCSPASPESGRRPSGRLASTLLETAGCGCSPHAEAARRRSSHSPRSSICWTPSAPRSSRRCRRPSETPWRSLCSGRTAISVGFLNALRALADEEPLLVAIDDVQWLDEASAEAIAFAARRLDGEAVAFLLARRPGTATNVEHALENHPLEHLEVGQLSVGATRRVLADELGLSVPRNLLGRIFESTLGNPLFALEVGRALAAGETPAIGDELPVPQEVDELLGARVERLADPLRKVLLALALQGDLRISELTAL